MCWKYQICHIPKIHKYDFQLFANDTNGLLENKEVSLKKCIGNVLNTFIWPHVSKIFNHNKTRTIYLLEDPSTWYYKKSVQTLSLNKPYINFFVMYEQ